MASRFQRNLSKANGLLSFKAGQTCLDRPIAFNGTVSVAWSFHNCCPILRHWQIKQRSSVAYTPTMSTIHRPNSCSPPDTSSQAGHPWVHGLSTPLARKPQTYQPLSISPAAFREPLDRITLTRGFCRESTKAWRSGLAQTQSSILPIRGEWGEPTDRPRSTRLCRSTANDSPRWAILKSQPESRNTKWLSECNRRLQS